MLWSAKANSERVTKNPPSLKLRAGLATIAALLSGTRAWLWSTGATTSRDFDQVWHAARAIFAGRDPYSEIGPGLSFEWSAYFYYPLTAPISVAPLALLPREASAVVFAALGSAAFVWASTRRSVAPALVITSASAAFAAEAVQWSPLLGAAFWLPWLGLFLASKPTIGLAILFARPSRIAVGGALALTIVSLALQPTWPFAWLHALHHTSIMTPGGTPFLAPIATPGGLTALLLLLRWRRPEARLILALAAVPQTTLLYETVPLFAVPQTLTQGALLWAGSWLVALWVALHGPYSSSLQRCSVSAQAMGWLLYLPCVFIVLRRPNEGRVHDRLESILRRARVPIWLAGRADVD